MAFVCPTLIRHATPYSPLETESSASPAFQAAHPLAMSPDPRISSRMGPGLRSRRLQREVTLIEPTRYDAPPPRSPPPMRMRGRKAHPKSAILRTADAGSGEERRRFWDPASARGRGLGTAVGRMGAVPVGEGVQPRRSRRWVRVPMTETGRRRGVA